MKTEKTEWWRLICIGLLVVLWIAGQATLLRRQSERSRRAASDKVDAFNEGVLLGARNALELSGVPDPDPSGTILKRAWQDYTNSTAWRIKIK